MNLEHYIQGIRRGRDINFLEREAMQDSFLADALEGYDKVRGDHSYQIESMIKQVALQTRSKSKALRNWSIAASILLLIAVGAYFLQDKFSFSPLNYVVEQTTKTPVEFPAAIVPAGETNNSSAMDSTDKSPAKSNPAKQAFFDLNLALSDSGLAYFIADEKSRREEKMLSLENAETDTISKVKEKKSEAADANAQKKKMISKPAVGSKEYEKYLKSQMIRPASDECSNMKGKVIVSFFVNNNGRPYDLSIMKSLCPAADAEAIRLVKEGPGWTAGEEQEQVKVEVKF